MSFYEAETLLSVGFSDCYFLCRMFHVVIILVILARSTIKQEAHAV